MTVEIKHDFSGIPNKIIAVWYENSNPTAEVGRRVLNPPHEAGGVMVVENLKRTVYQFKFYESIDGVALETLRHSWFVDGTRVKSTTIEFLHYIVGRGESGENPTWADPAPGDTDLHDQRLAGEKFEVSHRMIGIRPKSSYVVLESGGFGLVDGEVFEPDDHWVAILTRDVEVEAPETSGGDLGIHVVQQSEAFGDAYMNKKNVALFADTIATTTFPAFAEIPNCVCRFSTYGAGQQRYWKLQFASGNAVDYAGKARNYIALASNEAIELTFHNGACYVTDSSTRYQMAGQIIAASRAVFGTVSIHEMAGQEHNVSDYIRLIDELGTVQRCSYSDWNIEEEVGTKKYYPYRAKFAISVDGTKFRFPDVRGLTQKFYSPSDPRFTAGPMSIQKEGVNLSNVNIELHDGIGGDRANSIGAGNNNLPAGFAGMDRFWDWRSNKDNSGNPLWLKFVSDSYTASDNYAPEAVVML